MAWKIIAIAAGGAAGSVLRYVLAGLVMAMLRPGIVVGAVFPWGTMVVNVVGSFAIGLLAELLDASLATQNVRDLLIVGLLGGFTTFSTLSFETAKLLGDGEFRLATLNLVGSCLLGLAAVFAGFFAARWLIAMVK